MAYKSEVENITLIETEWNLSNKEREISDALKKQAETHVDLHLKSINNTQWIEMFKKGKYQEVLSLLYQEVQNLKFSIKDNAIYRRETVINNVMQKIINQIENNNNKQI